jgi:predicted ArsR family transcriptional regulator
MTHEYGLSDAILDALYNAGWLGKPARAVPAAPKTSNRQRALAYLHAHPGATSEDVGAHLDIGGPAARTLLNDMRTRGRVRGDTPEVKDRRKGGRTRWWAV